MEKSIKLFDPVTDSQEEDEIIKVLKSNFWASGAGTGYVEKFENKFTNFIKAKKGLAVNSGSAALHLALSILDVKDKEVILPSLTFVSTAHAVLLNGGKPVFADIDKNNLCLDPKSVEANISKKTKAIIPVHFAGMPCKLDELRKIASKNNLFVIEDAAHACGSKYKNKPIGSHGDYVCFSFHPVKNLAMPNGGFIAINKNPSEAKLERLKAKRWCGITNRRNNAYDVKEIGWNYYMNEFSAAIGLIQLKKLNKLNHKRKKIAKRYSDEIKTENKMRFSDSCSYHLFWILVKNRKEFMKKMLEKGIETGIHYKPVHKMKMYARQKIKLEVTDRIENQIVSLPIHPNLSDENVSKIIKTINQIL